MGIRTCPQCFTIAILSATRLPEVLRSRPTIQTLQRQTRSVAMRSRKQAAGIITQTGMTQCAACGLSAPFLECIDGKATETVPGRVRGRVHRGLICASCQREHKATTMTPKEKRKIQWLVSEAESIGSYTHVEMRLPEYQTVTGRTKGVRAWETRVSPDDSRWPILCATDAFMRYRERYCFTAPNRLPDAAIEWETGAGWAHSENPAWLRGDHVRLLKDFDGSIYAERVEHPSACGCPRCSANARKRILGRKAIKATVDLATRPRVTLPDASDYRPFLPVYLGPQGKAPKPGKQAIRAYGAFSGTLHAAHTIRDTAMFYRPIPKHRSLVRQTT